MNRPKLSKIKIISCTVLVACSTLLVCDRYEKPKPVKTPPLLTVSKEKWPKNALHASQNGIPWGQCTICGYPVTDEDVKHGYGQEKIMFAKG